MVIASFETCESDRGSIAKGSSRGAMMATLSPRRFRVTAGLRELNHARSRDQLHGRDRRSSQPTRAGSYLPD